MKIKESPNCNFCKDHEDSNEHMLFECENVKDLWLKVENWISDIGLVNYHLNNKKIILGELYKAHWINAIILITKKVIFNARTSITIPTFDSIKIQVKNLYKYEKYKYTLCDREDKLEQRWGILLDYFEE